jgi:hypothetical protein
VFRGRNDRLWSSISAAAAVLQEETTDAFQKLLKVVELQQEAVTPVGLLV